MNREQEFEELKATVRYLKDRHDILDCIQRESRARDRQDVDMIAGCWWEDGVDEHGPVVSKAPDYPARANAGHAANFNMTSHNITNHLCESGSRNCSNWPRSTARRPDRNAGAMLRALTANRLEAGAAWAHCRRQPVHRPRWEETG